MSPLPSVNLSLKSSEIIVDYKNIKNGECKEVSTWSWSQLKDLKYMVCNNNGKIEFFKIG